MTRPNREELWYALSELWLDTDLSESQLNAIAMVVRNSGLSERELEEVFALELAPFLSGNLRAPAGEWAGFDREWVIAEARKRHETRRFGDRVLAWMNISTRLARPAWNRVKELAE